MGGKDRGAKLVLLVEGLFSSVRNPPKSSKTAILGERRDQVEAVDRNYFFFDQASDILIFLQENFSEKSTIRSAGGCIRDNEDDIAAFTRMDALLECSKPFQCVLSRDLFDLIRLETLPAGLPTEYGRLSWASHGLFYLESSGSKEEICSIALRGKEPPDSWASLSVEGIVPIEESPVIPGWRPALGEAVPAFEDWRLEARLEIDRCGEVWGAIHLQERRRRAFRFFLDQEAVEDVSWRRLWLRRLAKRLKRDPRINRVYYYNFDRKIPLVVSSLPRYDPLNQERLHQLNLTSRLMILRQIAGALYNAHSCGVVHGDIAARNILVGRGQDGLPIVSMINFAIPGPRRCGESGEHESVDVVADLEAFGLLFYQVVAAQISVSMPLDWQKNVVSRSLRIMIQSLLDGGGPNPERTLREIERGLLNAGPLEIASLGDVSETRAAGITEIKYKFQEYRRRIMIFFFSRSFSPL